MKVLQLFESTLHIEELSSEEELQQACDLINDGAQLSWTLTPSRLLGKLGSSGKLFGLYDSNDMVGTIGLKETTIEGITGAEVGYLYIKPEARSFNAYTLLYRAIRDVANNYQFIFATTVTSNKTINTLMKRNQYVTFGFSQKSPFSSNILNYWIAHGTKMSIDKVEQHLSDEYLNENEEEPEEEEDTEFKIILSNVHEAPAQFQNYIYKLADKSNVFEIGESVLKGQAMIKFGRRSSISDVENTIHFGNAYYNKQSQYNMLKGKVPTVPTYEDSDDVGGRFIAKHKSGQRQEGQLINKVPENPEDYVFQPLLDIASEYRVVVYYMNGDYHLSGIYKKMGSNMSMTSITSGEVYNVCKNIAITAIKELGYGASGVDIAISKTEVSESLGAFVSGVGKISGKITRGKIEGNVYFLEANTMPSVSNPMILHDLVKSIKSNIK